MKNVLKNSYGLIFGLILASTIALGATYFDDIVAATAGIGAIPDSSNVFDVQSVTQSSRPCPVMTEAQRDAISSPKKGNCILNSDTNTLNFHNGTSWGQISDPNSVIGPLASGDNTIARFDGVTGKLIQDSLVTIDDAGVMSGATQLNVDAIRLDSSIISTTTTNASLVLLPNGSGVVYADKDLYANQNLVLEKSLQHKTITDSASTGTDVVLANPTGLAVNLTNASLTSVEGMASGMGTFATLTNSTPNVLVFKNLSGGAANYQFITGTGGDLEVEPTASILVYYEAGTVNKWRIIGGSGSGSGASPDQFITKNNSNFESGLGDWITYNDSAAAPVDCAGGTVASEWHFARESAAPLIGKGSGYINAENLANTQGNGVSVDSDTIPEVYRGRPLEIKMQRNGFGSYASEDFKLYAYDVTNSTLMNGGNPLASIDSGYGQTSAFLYPSISTENIRLCIHNTVTTTALKNLYFDEVKLKLTESVSVPLIQNGIKFTPTGSFTNTAYTGSYSIAGQWVDFYVRGTLTGTPASTTLTLNLPNGWNIDTNLVTTDSTFARFGYGSMYDNVTASYQMAVGGDDGTTKVRLKGLSSSPLALSNVTQANPFTWVSGDQFEAYFRLPIAELRQNTIDGLASQSVLDYQSTLSNVKTPTATNRYAAMTNNSVLLKAGKTYDVQIATGYQQAGSAGVAQLISTLFLSNGLDTSSTPTLLSSSSNIQVLSNYPSGIGGAFDAPFYINGLTPTAIISPNVIVRIRVLADTTVYAVPFLTLSTPANGRVQVSINAAEIPFSSTSINTGWIYLGQRSFTSTSANVPFVGKVYRSGKICRIEFSSVLTGSMPSGLNITLPPDLYSDYSHTSSRLYNVGTVLLRDTGTGANTGSAVMVSTSSIQIYYLGTNSNQTNLSSTTPFTWVAGDTITTDVEFPAAGW